MTGMHDPTRAWAAILNATPPTPERSRKVEIGTVIRVAILSAMLGAALGWWLP